MPYFNPTLIRDAYIEKCKYPEFSNNLKTPTEARVRNACINTYHKKNSTSDKWILRNFLGVTEDKDLIIALKEDVGKFRPIVNFFKNQTEDPRDETIELIAWLIDFKFEHDDDEQPPKPGETKKDPDNSGGKSSPGNPSKTPKSKLAISIACIILLITGVGAFQFWQDKVDRETITKDEKCMYWTGNHYEAIACDQEASTPRVPLNLRVLNHLKKITAYDTLTKKDLGKVWYTKIDKEVEFFTANGLHPIDTNRRLKPLTPYILSNYVSYHRYVLTNLIWTMSLIAVIALLIGLTYKHRKKGMRLLGLH